MSKNIGKKFTVILRTFNEADVLPYVLANLMDCRHIICIDSGSTDDTLLILEAHNIPVFSVSLEGNRSTPGYYREIFSYSSTKYILLVYCSHFYSKELINEIDYLANRFDNLDCLAIPYCHYMYREPAPAFSTTFKLTTFFSAPIILKSKPTTACSFFFNRESLDFSSFKIHFEFPVSNPKGLIFKRTNHVLTVARTEPFSIANTKTSIYSTIEADDNYSPKSYGFKQLCLVYLIYPVTFFSSFIFNGGFRYGVSGLVSSHLLASYKFAVLVANWEIMNGFKQKSDFLPSFLDRIH